MSIVCPRVIFDIQQPLPPAHPALSSYRTHLQGLRKAIAVQYREERTCGVLLSVEEWYSPNLWKFLNRNDTSEQGSEKTLLEAQNSLNQLYTDRFATKKKSNGDPTDNS